ncbi:DUF3530 family protein [Oceanicoccus sagamiensis]|uniref:Alpha/beta hydrolase n=1 Tax=Oceanicoccus sagamiensis TaxID=716816 RepID=A0A1X9N8B9_9GAMM|nr:DUF3530 family protein [Oceanicoccus sagamiensis]ARN74310.1 hypothetical protein BST96_09345 [Oceanicoccus sagamiensis]
MRTLFIGFSALLISLPLWAQEPTPEAAAPPPPPVTAAAGTETLLDQQVADNEKVWLPVAGSSQLAFYLNETSGKAHGGVILLPKTGQHPATKGSDINAFRIALSDNHWHTLALNSSEADKEQALAFITAGVNYLNQQGVYNIAILGEGTGAAYALHYAASISNVNRPRGQFAPIRAVVMINAENKLAGDDAKTLEQFTQIRMPILDAYSNSDYQKQRLADQRKRAARKKMNRLYQQIRLPQASGVQQNEDNRITKRIRGWLDKNVAGFMIDR